jgi:hypothetical protein
VRISGYPPRPRARASEGSRARGRGRREGRKGGRRGSRLRLGADFGVPSTPKGPSASEGTERRKEKEEGRGEEEAAGFA